MVEWRSLSLFFGSLTRIPPPRCLFSQKPALSCTFFQGIAAGLYCLSTPIPDFCQLVALECKVKSHALRRHLVEVVGRLRRKQQVTDAVRARARRVFDPDCPENHKVGFSVRRES